MSPSTRYKAPQVPEVPAEVDAGEVSQAAIDALPSDAERRLARIAAQHSPYTDTLEHSSGAMCRECGYVHPCPTWRMASTDTDPDGDWLNAEGH